MKLFLLSACILHPAFGVENGSNEAAEPKAAGSNAAEGGLAAAEAPLAKATAGTSVFPNVTTRWRKWEMGVVAEHALKNNWQPLPADSVRIIPYNGFANGVETSFQVNLNTGEVTVLSGRGDPPKIRAFKLQGTELENVRRVLESKQFLNLVEENQMIGRAGSSLLVESNWKGEYRWRLHWGDIPPELKEIEALIRKAYDRPD